MQFSAGTLAILASKAGGDRHNSRRSLTANANSNGNNKLHQYQHQVTARQQRHERLEAPSSNNNALKNNNNNGNKKKQQPRVSVASTVVNKLQQLREIVECDPLANREIEEDRRLRGGHYHHNTAEEAATAAAAADDSSSSSAATSSMDEDDKELGILTGSVSTSSSSCGVGRKCQEVSSTSTSTSLGGICVDVEGWNHHENLRERGLQEDSTLPPPPPVDDDGPNVIDVDDGPPGGEDYSSFIGADLQYACDYGALVGYDCVCDFDMTTYTGSATCTTPERCTTEPSICGVNVTDCYKTTYGIELQGTPGVWDSELCLQFLEPYQQTICYETSVEDAGNTVLPDCQISLDGEQCESCEVYKFRDDNCYVFDCGNTAVAGGGRGSKVGNTCDFPAHGVSLYLDTYGCPPCDLCGSSSSNAYGGDNNMTTPIGL